MLKPQMKKKERKMKKIKGFRENKNNYIHKIILEKYKVEKDIASKELKETEPKFENCFALVVVRKIPWYKKFVRSIRNIIVIYRWRKAR